MGPMLDIYLLTQQLEPFVQIGTRAAFFTLVNTIKLVLFLCECSTGRLLD